MSAVENFFENIRYFNKEYLLDELVKAHLVDAYKCNDYMESNAVCSTWTGELIRKGERCFESLQTDVVFTESDLNDEDMTAYNLEELILDGENSDGGFKWTIYER